MELLLASQWRSLTPADAFNRHQDLGWKSKLVHVSGFADFLSPQVQDIIVPADVVIFQRNILHRVLLDAITYFQGLGKPVVVDLDDAYQMLPWSNPAKNFWHNSPYPNPNGETKPRGALEFLEEGLRLSNGLISPNRLLLKDFEYASGASYYLQNYAEPEWWTNLPERAELKEKRGTTGKIVIGWGGSVSHYDSFWGNGIREAAERICRRHPEVVWLICGNDDRIYSHLPISNTQKARQLGVAPQDWPKVVAEFDIGVAPLAGPYDQRRSWIKGIEYLLGGVPWIATTGEPYRDIAHLGTLVPNGADAWEDALEDKITNLKREQDIARDKIPLAQQSFIVDNQLHVFAAVFNKIKADFQINNGLPGIIYGKARADFEPEPYDPATVYEKEGLHPKPLIADEEMIKRQTANLNFVEKWAGTMPIVNGVPVVRALTYDLIQLVNRVPYDG